MRGLRRRRRRLVVDEQDFVAVFARHGLSASFARHIFGLYEAFLRGQGIVIEQLARDADDRDAQMMVAQAKSLELFAGAAGGSEASAAMKDLLVLAAQRRDA